MKKLLFFAATVCTMLSCNNNGGVIPEAEKIPINISVGQQTRANDEVFEDGDEVGIYVVNYDGSTAGTLAVYGNQVDNAQFTFDGSKWTPENSIYWKNANTAADFYAYYPYSASPNISAHPFSVQADQSDEDDFWASDFLWGKATNISPTPNAVSIQTNHSLSRIILDVKAGEGFTAESWADAEKSVKICDVKTSATIDLSTGVATVTGNAGEIVPLAAAETGTTLTYKAMMIPQVVADNSKLVVVTVDGTDYVYRKGYTFSRNTQHTFTVTVNKSGSNVDVTIGEWEIDSTTNEGDAEEESESESTIPNNQIWYTATAKVEPKPSANYGATIESNEWDSATGKGVITFDGEVTSIVEEAFRDRSKMTSIVLPNSVKTIAYEAFCYCSNLTGKITIPESVVSIEERAFMGCSLSSFEGKFASSDGRLLVNNSKAIAFAPYGLESYTFPDNITTIGTWLIYGCHELRSLVIPSSVTVIEDYAIYNCSKIDNITIGEEVVSIGKESFWNCPSLRHITIPKKVSTIGFNTFGSCSLEYIKFESTTPPSGLGIYTSTDVGHIYVPSGAYTTYCNNFSNFEDKFVTYRNIMTLCKNQPSNEIWYYSSTTISPSTASAINASITKNQSSGGYGVMTFDDAITTIGKSAFDDVANINAIYIPEGITTIGDYAFEDCKNLYTIVLPESVNNIGRNAFFNYYARHISLYCRSLNPPSIDSSILNVGSSYNHIIYVPTSAVEVYKAADGWKDYADYIVGYDF